MTYDSMSEEAGVSASTEHDNVADSATDSNANCGLDALVALLAVHRVPADTAQLRHLLGHDRPPTADELVRLARRLPGVRAKSVSAGSKAVAQQPLPALAHGPEGWFVIGRAVEDGVLVQRPTRPVETLSHEALTDIWSGRLILLTTREAEASGSRRFDLRWFIPQIARYRALIGEVLLITFALNVLALAGPLLFQNIIDKVLVHNTMATLNVLAIGFVAVSVWEVAFGWLRTRLFSETTQKIDVELGARLFRHLLALPLGYFERRRVGDTVTRVRQLETIREFLTNASLTVLVDPLFAVLFVAAMLLYSPWLSLIAFVAMAGYVLVSRLATPLLRRRLDEKFERSSASNALLVESVTGIHTVKASAVEPQWQNRWEKQLAAYSAASQRVINIGNGGTQAIELISKLSFAAILYFGAKAVISGGMSVGELVAFNMFAQRLTTPVLRMSQLWQEFQQVRISVERLGDVLNHPAEPAGSGATALPTMRGSIRFEDVRFRYGPDSPSVLEGIHLDVPAGSSLGIVGSSGSGKSTLTKLLQRMYLPERGRVLVDGFDVAQLDPAWLRRQIGVVLQENLLFSRTIRENIALANPALPLEQVVAAAKLAGAHDFISKLPLGYETEVVERGANLSGGQRQRIAIARALINDPRILIFDEATSALDAESEEIVRDNLKAMAAGRTVIIIAHRLSAVRQCDRIVTIEKGRVVEAGSHEELIHGGGRYADLHRRQIGPMGVAA